MNKQKTLKQTHRKPKHVSRGAFIAAAILICLTFSGCEESNSTPKSTPMSLSQIIAAASDSSADDRSATIEIGKTLSERQPTPTDIDYSLERYNLIRRAYWVNGQREKANTLICEVVKPLGYVVLFTEGGRRGGQLCC